MDKDALLRNIDNKGKANLFKDHPALEPFSKTTPIIIYCIYIPIISFSLYWSVYKVGISLPNILLLFLGGIFLWTFIEYLVHRFLFHIISEKQWLQNVMYNIHGFHHEFPRDKERLFLPPVPSIVIAVILFFAFRLVLQEYIFAFFPGFLFGYLCYGSIHYAIHAFNPPFKFMKAHWRNHHLHHYKSPDRGFGVSSPLWDYIFGTMHDLKNKD